MWKNVNEPPQEISGNVPIISTRKRLALMATRVVILFTLPGIIGGSHWHGKDQKGTDLQRPVLV